jgi:hypothetical protein
VTIFVVSLLVILIATRQARSTKQRWKQGFILAGSEFLKRRGGRCCQASVSIAPVVVFYQILPMVRPSRGRRRTPLVSMSRKIIINTTTGVPKTESFARS